MEHDYPARLSVAELRQELDAYLEYRRMGGANRSVEEPTIIADRTPHRAVSRLAGNRPGRAA